MRRFPTVKQAIFLFISIAAFLIVLTSTAQDLDAPHNDSGDEFALGCMTCHDMGAFDQPNLIPANGHVQTGVDDTLYNNLCGNCHDGVTAPDALPHTGNAGDWSVQCWVCHNQHTQEQLHKYNSGGYLFSGPSAGIDTTTITVAGSPWTPDQYAGFLVVPNTADLKNNYRIISNTADTLTVRGPIDLSKAGAGDTIAIVYGKFIRSRIYPANITGRSKPELGAKNVKFLNVDQLADGDATYNGICEVCHTQTGHHKNTPDGDHDHYKGQDCIPCHSHSNGFVHGGGGGTNCIECHVTVDDHDHRVLPSPNTGCAVCHDVPDQLKVDTIHLTCIRCHGYAGAELDKGTVAATIKNGKGITGADQPCENCHTVSHETNTSALHDNRVTTGLDPECSACHDISSDTAIDNLHKGCKTCHFYSGSKLDKATVAGVISAGRDGGTPQNCQACHTGFAGSIHHITAASSNTDCATTCHTSVDHTNMVINEAPCDECHTDAAGGTSGMPVSLTDRKIHNSCRSCHTFNADKRGVLVDITNRKGIVGPAALPDAGTIGETDGGGTCTVCHTETPPEAYHHNSPQTQVGQCEYCHVDPRPTWGPNTPGDNGSNAGLSRAMPTQMACRQCHVAWSGGNMTVTKFTRPGVESDYKSYRYPWVRTIAHTVPMNTARINNYGICFSCHYVGNTKVPAAPAVRLWHAIPAEKGGNNYWKFIDQYWGSQGTASWRGSNSATSTSSTKDGAHYAPGRSPVAGFPDAHKSGISGFNIFAPNYGVISPNRAENRYTTPISRDTDRDAFVGPGEGMPTFARVSIPTNDKIGKPLSTTLDRSTRAVPVFASITPLSVAPTVPDEIKVKSAIYATTALIVVASTNNACADLSVHYGPASVAMSGSPANCAATITNPNYPADGTTIDVTTSNPLGLNVTGFPISEPNPGVLSFTTTDYSVSENATTATITVSRTIGATGNVKISWVTVNGGSATMGSDYIYSYGVLSWADGDMADKSFTFSIANDPDLESDETVHLALLSPLGGAVQGKPDNAVVTIRDDDFVGNAGTLAFAASNYTVAENGGSVEITVSRTGGSSGEISVTYSTNTLLSTAIAGTNPTESRGTKNSGADYLENKGTLTWTDGDTADKIITITSVNHDHVRGNKNINLYLFNPTGGAVLGAPNFADVEIISPAIKVLDPWSSSLNITGTTGNMSGTFAVSSGTNRLLVVAISCSDTITNTTGQTFAVTYGGKPLTQAVVQNSNIYQTWIGYLKETDIASRSGNTLAVTVNGAHTRVGAFVASYENVNQVKPLADAGSNYNSSYSENVSSGDDLYLAAGGYGIYNWSGSSSYPRNYDDEGYAGHADQNYSGMRVGVASKLFTMASPTNPYVSWGPGRSTSFIILNAYAVPPQPTFLAGNLYVKENEGTAVITVPRLGSSLGELKAEYATYGGLGVGTDAIEWEHYEPALGVLTWPDGDMSDKYINVNIIDNAEVNYDRRLRVTFGNNYRDTWGPYPYPITQTYLNIVNDESDIYFSSSGYSVAENESSGVATITVSRAGYQSYSVVDEVVGVSYSTVSGGTAVEGDDYTATSGTLIWAAGDMDDQTFTIPIVNNGVDAPDKTINLQLSSPIGYGSSLGSPSSAVLTIVDDEASLAFASSAFSVKENDGSATITVVRQGDSTQALSVDYATIAGGTATDSVDYNAVSGTLNWGVDDMADKTFTIPVTDDSDTEVDETIHLQITNVIGGVNLGEPNIAVLTIDDDDHSGVISFSSATYTVDEDVNGSEIAITATRTGGADKAVSVSYAGTGGTAMKKVSGGDQGDYSFNNGTLSWADGDSADKTFIIRIYTDTRWEDDETVNLELSNPTGGVTIGAPGTAVLTITDNEDNPGALQFSSSTYTVDEAAGSAIITVKRVGGNNSSGGFYFYANSSAGGTASRNVDYGDRDSHIPWNGDFNDEMILTVPIYNDSTSEPDETVNLSLTWFSGDLVLGDPVTATLTIVDDDNVVAPGTISFAPPTYTIQEDVGTVTITVNRTGGTTGAVSVDFTSDQDMSTALAGSDFTAVSGTLSWADGESGSKTFSLSIHEDNLVEIDERIILHLNNVTGGAALGQDTATVSITGPAVAELDPFLSTYHELTWWNNDSIAYNISDGQNRLLVVSIQNKPYGTGKATFDVKYGGKSLTRAVTHYHEDGYQTWFGYLKEKDIAERINDTLSYSISGDTMRTAVFVASYINVDQLNPVRATGGAIVNFNNTPVNPVPVEVGAGGYAIYNWNSYYYRTSDTENYTEHSDSNLTYSKGGVASKPFAIRSMTKPVVNWESLYVKAAQSIITLNRVGDSQDADLDTVLDDGDGSGVEGDNPCTGGQTVNCDDNCVDVANPDQADADSDGVGDACDNCSSSNADQSDRDCDGIGDACQAPVYFNPTDITFTPGSFVTEGTISWNDVYEGEDGYRLERKAEACNANNLNFEPLVTIYRHDDFARGIDQTAWTQGMRLMQMPSGNTYERFPPSALPAIITGDTGLVESKWLNGKAVLHTVSNYYEGDGRSNHVFLEVKNFAELMGDKDYDIEFEYQLSGPSSSVEYETRPRLGINYPATTNGNNSMYLERRQHIDPSTDEVFAVVVDGTYVGWKTNENTGLSGKLRLVNSNGYLSGYTWNGTGWELLDKASEPFPDGFVPTWAGLVQYSSLKEPGGKDITSYVDNFKFNTVGGVPVAQLQMDFNESGWSAPGDVIDSAADESHGTPNGGANTNSDAVRGTFGDFDGADDYVEIPGDGILGSITGSSFTFAAWAKPRTVPPGLDTVTLNDKRYGIISRPNPAQAGEHFALTYNMYQKFRFTIFTDTGEYWLATDEQYDPADGLWYHIAGVADDTAKTISIYVDGQFKKSIPYTGNLLDYTTLPYYIGVGQPYTSHMWYLDGQIDEARIFDHALTSTEVDSLYKNRVQFKDITMEGDTQYCYRVYPLKNDTCTGWSNHGTEINTSTVNSLPATPGNQSPVNATDVYEYSPTLSASSFSDPDAGDTHSASQWQISTDTGANFDANRVYNAVTAPAESHLVTNTLSANTLYYWHVRYQDSKGEWSLFSSETSFNISNAAPNKPSNNTPANLATGVPFVPTLTASPFSDDDAGDTHLASQWLVSTAGGADFAANLFYDSNIVPGSNTHTMGVSGTFNSTYFWKVSYQDNRGLWSEYSDETSFTITSNITSDRPENITPVAGTVDVARKPTFTASAFADGDAGDTHQKSQWQVSTGTGADFDTNIVYDSGITSDLTTHTGTTALPANTTCYWRVRYQDSRGGWSNYSVDTSFTTTSLVSLFHFDEGINTTVSDDSGDNNGTLRNGVTWETVAGYAGNSVNFDGVAADVVWNYQYGSPVNNFTIEAMVKATTDHEIDPEATVGTTGTLNQRYLFGVNLAGSPNAGAGISMGTDGISVYEHSGGYMPPLSVYDPAAKNPVEPQLGTDWHHVVVTYTDKQPQIYLDGYLVHTGLVSPRAYVFPPNTLGGGSYGFFPGTVDEVAIYAEPLSDKEVLQRCLDLGQCVDNDMDSDGVLDINDNCLKEYNPDQADLNGDGVGNVCDYIAYWKLDDASGTVAVDETGGHDGTLIGGTGWTSGIAGSGGLLFDGTDDGVTADNVLDNWSGNFSLSVWLKFPTGAVNPRWSIGKGDAYRGIGFGIAHWVTADTPVTPYFFLNDGVPGEFLGWEYQWPHRLAVGPTKISRGEWSHFVWTVDRTSQVMKVYKNGKYENQVDISILGTNPITDTSILDLGLAASGARYNGTMDNVAIYDFVLDDGDVMARCLDDSGGDTATCDGDFDDDGYLDPVDNCVLAANADQADGDGDGVGDACDNCNSTPNTNQADADNDGIGDTCDTCPNDPDNDIDSDGLCGDIDNCPSISNVDQTDSDCDGIGDACDPPSDYTPSSLTVTPLTSTDMSVMWDDMMSGENGYRIERKAESCSATTLSFAPVATLYDFDDFAQELDSEAWSTWARVMTVSDYGNPASASDSSGLSEIAWENGAVRLHTVANNVPDTGYNRSSLTLKNYQAIIGDKDFDIQFDYSLPLGTISTTEQHIYARLWLMFPDTLGGTNQLYIDRKNGNVEFAGITIDGKYEEGTLTNTGMSGRLRLVRNNRKISAYAWNGSGWQQLLEHSQSMMANLAPTWMAISQHAKRNEPTGMDITAVVENFRFNRVGSQRSYLDNGLTAGTPYCYRVYPFKTDSCPNWPNHDAEAWNTTLSTIDGNATLALASTAIAVPDTQSIYVQMPYLGDSNTSSTYTVEYKADTDITWTSSVTDAPNTSSPFILTISGLANKVYDVRVTYNDADGVNGVAVQTVTGILVGYPASCLDALNNWVGAPDGVYTIDPDGFGGNVPYDVYCDMTNDGGGWTLAMKLNGNSSTFEYASSYWTTTNTLNTGSPDFDTTQAKLKSFNEVPFTQIRLGMRNYSNGSDDIDWITIDRTANSLVDVFNSGYIATTVGRANWLTLLEGMNTAPNCNKEGFNAEQTYSKMRIGLAMNGEANCTSCDNILGFGNQITGHPWGNWPVVGGGKANDKIYAYGWIMVR